MIIKVSNCEYDKLDKLQLKSNSFTLEAWGRACSAEGAAQAPHLLELTLKKECKMVK